MSTVVAVKAKVYTPKGDGTSLDLSLVENYLRDEAKRYTILEVNFDPHMFIRSAQMLSDEGFYMVEFPQTNERMAPATKRTYDLIISERLNHNGNREHAEHMGNAAQVDTERGTRLTKRKATGPMDAAVGTVMAASRADELGSGGGVEW